MPFIEFSLTKEDFARLQRVVGKRVRSHAGLLTAPFFAQMFAWMFATLPLFAALRMWKQGGAGTSSTLYLLGSLVLAFLLAAIVVPWASQRLMAQYALSDRGTFYAKQRISLYGEGLEVVAAHTEARVRWSGIIGWEVDDMNYYLFVDALQALIVPRPLAKELGSDFLENLERVRREV